VSPAKKGLLTSFVVVAAGIAVSLIFQNCSGFQAQRFYQAQKASHLGSSRIFVPQLAAAPEKEFGSEPDPMPNPNPNPNPGPNPGPDPIPVEEVPAPGDIAMKAMCSDKAAVGQVGGWGGPAAFAANLRFRLVAVNAGQVTTHCEFTVANTDDLKNKLMRAKKLPLRFIAENCPQTTAGTYFLVINDPTVAEPKVTTIYSRNRERRGTSYIDAIRRSTNGEDLMITRDATGWKANERAQFILADNNPRKNIDPRPFGYLLDVNECDDMASPLMVKLSGLSGADSVGLRLTSRPQGILFDALGETSEPAFSPVRVSWVTDNVFAFFALPDASGNVTGVNQLFGDRTRGPDGEFAFNGYEALAKWDGRPVAGAGQGSLPDGVIDPADPVYEKLRLWIDVNRDGFGPPSELWPLSRHNIKTIDLNYDPHYYERDVYGNEIRFKSVAVTVKGQLMTVFDLWFNYEGTVEP